MNYSYTQVVPFFGVPFRGRQHELEGETPFAARASVWFGRAFERALAALFRQEDPVVALYQSWSLCRQRRLVYSTGDTWDSMLWQGVKLLERFVQDGRIEVPDPNHLQQIPVCRQLSSGNQFVAIIDAIGKLDGVACLLEWKTASTRHSVNAVEMTALDPQLLCYAWVTGIERVVQVVFARSRPVEVQYLQAVINSEIRQQVAIRVEHAISQFESGVVPAHYDLSIAPHNSSRSTVALRDLEILESSRRSQLHRRRVSLGLFDELAY